MRGLLALGAWALVCCLGAVRGADALPGAAPLAWPGGVITVNDGTLTPGGRAAVMAAASAWNRVDVGVRFRVGAIVGAEVRVVAGAGRCLPGRAGSAPSGYVRPPGSRVVFRSCPAVVLPLLAAHELGRVLGLPVDDRVCSLMNSFGLTDSDHFAVPGRCSAYQLPSWLRELIDPFSIAAARALYASPRGPLQVALREQAMPRVGWRLPADSGAAWDVVLRGVGRCPTEFDLAAGRVAVVYRKRAYAGLHWLLDTSFPNVRESYCYGVFTVSASGRATRHPGFVSFVFDRAPVAAFTFAPSAPTIGQSVVFSDQSSDPDGSIVHWQWNFGDPASGPANIVDTTEPSLGRAPAHIYTTAGTYTVSLTVTDDGGKQMTSSVPVTVS